MISKMRATYWLPIGLALASLGGCSFSLHERQIRLEVDHLVGTSLDVHTENGPIEIRSSAGDRVQVLATVKARTKERAAEVTIETTRTGDGTLRIRPIWPGGERHGNEACGLEIALPEVHGVHAETSNGHVIVRGCDGPIVARTSNGSVQVFDVSGGVTIETSNGKVGAERIHGPLNLRTSNGAVRVLEASGTIHARTSNGSVLVQAADTNAGPFEIRSSNGGITLHAPGFRGELELETSNGLVAFDGDPSLRVEYMEKTEALMVRGDSKVPSSVHTSNGSIRVHWSPTGQSEGKEPPNVERKPARRSF
ncbi:MAG: DUF4097 family beta strand repeat protein [Planctomycetes bacterium]|nr:DUF4097 family beta strand repeat protein [Planctomycetota bacterium]MCB9891562.1 DUF4097 family beta strand repeat protein [Planctomycetota bacterium]